MSDERPAWRKQLEQSLTELETLGKQIGSKLGEAAKDASHEAKDAWHKLEPRIGEVTTQVSGQLGTKLREASGEAQLQLEGMVAELRASLKALRDKL